MKPRAAVQRQVPESSNATPARRRWPLVLALAMHVVSGGWLIASKGIGTYFYDERFTLENLRRIYLQQHPVPTSYFWYAPLSYVPQATVLLAADRLGRGLAGERAAIFEPSGRPTLLGIRIARSFGILYGALTLIALHAVCQRLWDRRHADFAVVALAASPWLARGNAEFKPDALLLLLTVAGFVPLLRFARDGRARDRRLAALAAGAAAAAKLNGAWSVVPLGIACLAQPGWRNRSRLTAESAAIALGAFLLLNPWPAHALHYLRRVESQFDLREESLGFLAMLGTLLGNFLDSGFLGPLLGSAAAAGLLLAARSLWRRPPASRFLALALWLLYPVSYLLFLCASTRYPKENLLLPALPFAAALAGLALATAAGVVERRRPRLADALLPAIALWSAASLARYTAREIVPQAADLQVRALRGELRGANGRVIAWHGGAAAIREFVDSGWGGVPPTVLALDDALAEDPARLAQLDCVGGYGRPPAGLERRLTERFRPRRFDARPLLGSLLVQRTRRPWHGCRLWQRRGVPIALVFEPHSDGWWTAALPATLPAHDAFTLNGRARLALQPEPPPIEIGGRPIPLRAIGVARRRWLLLGSERVPLRVEGGSVRVRSPPGAAPELELLLWGEPAAPAVVASPPSSSGESG